MSWMNSADTQTVTTRVKKRNKKHYKNHIPKYLSRRDKFNLKNNLATLGEKKYIQFNYVPGAGVPYTGQMQPVTVIPQGTTDSDRSGDQIALRSIEIQWGWYIDGSVIPSTELTNIVRIIVFQWIPDTVPVRDNILSIGVTTPPSLYPHAPYNHDKRFQFRILYDKKQHLSYYGPAVAIGRKRITRFPQRKIQFQSGTTVGTNQIYVLYLSDSGATPNPTMSSSVKVNYQDN